MNGNTTIMAGVPEPRVRHMSQYELPIRLNNSSFVNSEMGFEGDPAGEPCFPEIVGWIAELKGSPAGSAFCAIVRPTPPVKGAAWLQRLTALLAPYLGRRDARPLRVVLLKFVLGPSSEIVERALLRRLVEELQSSWVGAPVVVPETNLAAQLFLRDATYRAVRVLRNYFGDEDGFLMTNGQESV